MRGSQPVAPIAPIAPVATVGPATFVRWSGLYFGGQVGYKKRKANFADATQPLVHFSLRELRLKASADPSQWAVLGQGSDQRLRWRRFVGYNTQWQDLVIGFEGNYNREPISIIESHPQITDRPLSCRPAIDYLHVSISAAPAPCI